MCLCAKNRIFLITSLLCMTITGCKVGPNYHAPKSPSNRTYSYQPLPIKTTHAALPGTSGNAQYFEAELDVPAQWWTLFQSRELNNMVKLGLANSPNLAAAEATLRQTQESVRAQIDSSLYPSGGFQFAGQRQRTSNIGFSNATATHNLFSLYNTSVNIAYVLDFFGGGRRGIKSLLEQEKYQHFQFQAAQLTLSANIVTASITVASLNSQIQATEQLVKSQQETLNIVKKQFALGSISQADVYSQASQLAQTRASLPPLQKSRAQSRHALSVLLGRLPSDPLLPEYHLNKLNLPTRLPVSLPSSLVRQRPDIRAAEAMLSSASEQIGVATAKLYPQLTLTGNYGWQNTHPANIVVSQNSIWNYGMQLLQPIFNAAQLQANRRAAIAGYQIALAKYQQTVLQGFQNVADCLRAIESDAATLRAERQAELAARDSLSLTEKQFRLGGVSYIVLLNAERQYQQAKIGRIQAQAARFTDTAALFQALGGGWWNQPDAKLAELEKS